MNQNFPPVNPEKAKLLTANWRDYYAAIYNNPKPPITPPITPDGESVFRGFRVPLEDLTQILEVIKMYNELGYEDKINSIRVYLAKDSADEKIMDDIHILLVPVIGGVPIPGPGQAQKFGIDMLEFDDKVRGKIPTIYNFSTPCPRQCDVNSALYKREKGQEKK